MFTCSYFAVDCLMSYSFQYRFPTQKLLKVSPWFTMHAFKIFLHFSGGRECVFVALDTATDFTPVEETVERSLLSMFTK